MSQPFDEVYCDRCEYRRGSFVLWGRLSYMLPSGKQLHLNRRLGWCHTCKEIVAMEDIATEALLQVSIDDCTVRLEAISRLKNGRLFKRLLSYDRTEIIDLEENLSDLCERLALLRQRSSLERCLSCGSTEVVPISLPAVDREPVQLDFSHPGCGGNFWAAHNPTWLNMRFEEKYYNVEGEHIGREQTLEA